MKRLSRLFPILCLTLIVMFSTGFKGCSNGGSGNTNGTSSSSITKALDVLAKSSRELAHDTTTAEKVVGILYNNGKLDITKKDEFANKFGLIAVKGKAFNELVTTASQQERNGSLQGNTVQLLKSNWAAILASFDDVKTLISTSPPAAQPDLEQGISTLSINVGKMKSAIDNVPVQ